eukprot:CAMPEP_0176221560 /NCGR_PEP_ID=MMETSP0121_2-20121125/19789_1 /TAXON_ID=160619 /ORGANISM="Kryptoperidinium foliaceum, Strain CCMP 1326" /LENGTH=218 /DNA_ID=CAMNT_0017560761 /DNA_START=1 /DNA_END=657 /DNA_ORIENTATION=-
MATAPRALCALLLVVPASCGPGVVDLTEADFEARVADGKPVPWLLDFYAPWCGHCKLLAPVLDELAERLDGAVNVGKVDCTSAQWLAEQYDIGGYPTLKLVAGGKVHSYQAKRSVELLEAFARGGYQETEAEPLPKDKPWHVQVGKILSYTLTAYAAPVFIVLSILGTAFVCWSTRPTPEDLERRQRFQARLAEAERRLAEGERKAAGGADAGDKKED